MAKRTGLGRGIGALIPTSEPTEDRPTDVFFPRTVIVDGRARDGTDADAELDGRAHRGPRRAPRATSTRS